MRVASWTVVAALALFWGAGAAFADDADFYDPDEGRFTATLGGDYSTGDYGDPETTRIRSVSLGLRYARGPWTGRVSVPQLWVTGPGNVLPGTGLVDNQNQPVTFTSRSERGLGDVVASVSYLIDPEDRRLPLFELTGKVKFGTASENKDLGTGRNDYSLLLDISKTFGDYTPFVTGGYRWVGDAEGIKLNDTWLASVGVSARITDRISGGVVYDYRESASSGSGDSHEIGPYFSYRLSEHWKTGVYGFVGLSTNSADYGVGTNVAFGW